MEIIPIEFCDVSDDYININRSLTSCAFEHGCGESGFSECPLALFYSENHEQEIATKEQTTGDMPEFYISDL